MRIDRYIFGEWLKIFGLAVAAILGLLLLGEVYNELPRFIDREASLETVLLYFFLLIPGYLPSLLPICFFLSLLFSLASLQRNGEIVAIRSAGVSLFRLSRPFWVAALGLAGLLLWLNGSLAPSSMESSRLLRERVKEDALAGGSEDFWGTSRDLAAYLPQNDELWFVENYRRTSDEAFGLSVNLSSSEAPQRIEAARGVYDEEKGQWTLTNGVVLPITPADELPGELVPFDEMVLEGSRMTPILLLGFSQRPKDLSLLQLDQLLRQSEGDPKAKPYRVRYLAVLSAPLQFFVVVLIAIPCALGTGRSGASSGFFRAVWIYLGFFAVTAVFSFAGQRSWLPVLASTWTPLVLAGVAGVWMYRRNA
ncbi:MAG: LptF/LptG family permease [Verrucomicrobiota bacterium]